MPRSTLKILYIGKYPPYVGGETTKAYWLLKSLAERGHKIFVITDVWELPDYWSAKLTVEDLDLLQPNGVKMFSTTFHNMSSFIPPYNPKTEKLVSLGIELIESFGEPDIIFSWYLVPFSSAAYILQQKYKIPHIIHHAGSDIQRLLFSTYLQDYLIEVLRNANGIITYPSRRELIKELNQNILIHGYPLNPDPYYRIRNNKCSTNNLIRIIDKYSIDDKWREINMSRIENCINNGKFFVAVPGKWERSKGIYSWLTLASKMNEICFILVGNGMPQLQSNVITKVRELDNVIWIGFIPTWRMPEVYKAVDIVGHLEIRFPVPGHFSLLALESLLAGKIYLTNIELSQEFCNFIKIELDEKDFIKRNNIKEILILVKKENNCRVELDSHRREWNKWIKDLEKFFIDIINTS